MTYSPKSQVRPIPYNGAPSSADLRASQDEMITDLRGLANVTNTNEANITELKTLLFNEIRSLKNAVSGLRDSTALQGLSGATEGRPFVYINTLGDTDDVDVHPGTPLEHRIVIDRDYRIITPPRNNATSMFYDISATNPGEVVTLDPTLAYELTEGTGVVDPGQPLNAFNGNNNSFWVRKVSHPLSSDIEKVTMQVEITIPNVQHESNVLQLLPFPFNSVTIEDVEYVADLGNSYQTIARIAPSWRASTDDNSIQFQPIRNADPIQIFFPPATIRKIRLTVSQDNWIEENGRKVFYYGFQEIGLWYVEYEDAKDTADPFSHTKNNNIVFRIDAPTGWKFGNLEYFNCWPYLDGNISQPSVLWQLGLSDTDFSSQNIVWTSLQQLPQAGNIRTVNASSLWAKCVLNIATQAGTFPIGTPGYVRSFMAHLTLEAAV